MRNKALSRLSALGCLMFVVVAMTVPVWCWGNEGHRAVALIAEQQLSSPVKAQIQALVGTTLSALATCADEVRSHERKPQTFHFSPPCLAIFPPPQPTGTANWHFIDLDVRKPDLTDPAMDQFCNNDCAVAKILFFQSVLANKTAPVAARRQALAFLVHFVGDVHQPLHSAERDQDHGGNLVTVRVPTAVNGHRTLKQDNLHSVWDGDIIESIAGDEAALVSGMTAQIAAAKTETIPADIRPWVHSWARQAEAIAKAAAYRDTGVDIDPNATPRHLLSANYESVAADAITLQLARAGVRLAVLINLALK